MNEHLSRAVQQLRAAQNNLDTFLEQIVEHDRRKLWLEIELDKAKAALVAAALVDDGKGEAVNNVVTPAIPSQVVMSADAIRKAFDFDKSRLGRYYWDSLISDNKISDGRVRLNQTEVASFQAEKRAQQAD